MKPIIKVSHLAKQFNGNVALENISFRLEEGEIFGFLGPSGAGKTTTINILTGQLKADAGQVEILNKDVATISTEDLKEIGIVSDKSGYYEKLSMYKNLLFYAKLFRQPRKRVDELLKRVGLYENKDKVVEKLSTGMKQRMLLVRALINQPKILFLDEPTSGLDPMTSKKIHKLLLELKKKGTTIFLTTHDMNEATILCDQLVLLNQGLLVEAGTPQELIQKYNHDRRATVTFDSGHQQQISLEKGIQLADTEQQITAIHSCEPTLEDIFITLTGVRLHD